MATPVINFILVILLPLNVAFPDDLYKPEYRYIEEGDVNIGAILSVHTASSPMNCSTLLPDIKKIQNVEALHFAVQEINNRSDILPDLRLGFVAFDDCHSSQIALGRAIQFMPLQIRNADVHNITHDNGDSKIIEKFHTHEKVFYDVAGVIGPYTSELSIYVANVLNLFRIPQISQTATSDILSDKTRFPYFFRMVPPDRYQVQAIARLLQHFNWTHISILYSEGSYGREGLKELRLILRDSVPSVCIEDSIEITHNSGEDNLHEILFRLKSVEGVKVVVAFVELEDSAMLSNALASSKLEDRFVWLGSDGISTVLGENPEKCLSFPSSLVVQPQSGKVGRFRDYLAGLRAGLFHSTNPWTNKLLEYPSNLYIPPEISTGRRASRGNEDHLTPSFAESYIIDSVYALAHAIDNVVKKNCSKLSRKSEKVKCVMEVGILTELKSIKFNGSFGTVKFNNDGDVLSEYVVRQCINNIGSLCRLHKVGCWDMSKEKLTLNDELMLWPDNEAPQSSCSEPCWTSIGKIYHFTHKTCCWECLSCKQNEIVTENLTRCESCPNFYWPDESRTYCIQIMPFYMNFTEPVAIGLGATATAGIIACLLIGTALIKYRDAQVIKCTSVELSFMVLVGAFMAYCLPLSFLSKPNTYKCYINHVGFSLTFTIVYAPLLVKTNRIYRIFKAGRRTTRKPWCISKGSQILISAVLITIQVSIVYLNSLHNEFGAQRLTGRVLDSRLRGRGFDPHRCPCIVVLEQDTFILA